MIMHNHVETQFRARNPTNMIDQPQDSADLAHSDFFPYMLAILYRSRKENKIGRRPYQKVPLERTNNQKTRYDKYNNKNKTSSDN